MKAITHKQPQNSIFCSLASYIYTKLSLKLSFHAFDICSSLLLTSLHPCQ